MSLTIPTQAIKFIESDELSFNESDICGCETNEKWSYTFTSGDNICFQVISSCEESEELLLNGSFEDGSSSTSIDNWVRDVDNPESTNVTRVESAIAQCGEYIINFVSDAQPPTTATLTQTLAESLEQGKTYKFTIKCKYVTSGAGNGVGDAFQVIIGGQNYYITPTQDWAEYTILATFTDAPANNDIVLTLNEAVTTDVENLYVDCAEMIVFGDCCLTPHENNGCFELGQQVEGEVLATFDNWVTSGVTEDLTGGFDGGRCVKFSGIGETVQQNNVFVHNVRTTISFWARSEVNATTLQVRSNTLFSEDVALTTTWTKYTYTFNNVTDDDIIFELTGDEISYLDCVEIISLPELSIYIKNLENDELQAVNLDVVEVFEGGFNVCIPVDDYIMPECFRICLETCVINLFLNGDFEQGSGNLFTSWTLTQPSRTNHLQYANDYTQAIWTKSNLTISGNKLVESAGVSTKSITQSYSVVANTRFTWGVSLKADGRNFVRLVMSDNATGQAAVDVNLVAGTISGTAAGGSWTLPDAQIVADGDYWRVRISATKGAGSVVLARVNLANPLGTTSYNGNGTSGVLMKDAQLEDGSYMTPFIPTTTASVTTSLGEFLQDASGGPDGSRALKMWASTGATNLTQSVSLVNGVQYTVSFWARVDELYGNDYVTGPADATLITSTEWTYYSQIPFTQVGTGSFSQFFDFTNDANFGFVYLDKISITPTEEIVTTCSEDMTYTEQLDSCIKELVWYDESESTDVMGIDYTTGFKNRLRVNAIFLNPQYLKEEFTKTLNGDVSLINSIKVKKTLDFSADALPEFIWDRLAGMLGVSNIEYNGKEYASVTESEVSLTGDKSSRLYSGTITLSPKGEYVAQRSYNC